MKVIFIIYGLKCFITSVEVLMLKFFSYGTILVLILVSCAPRTNSQETTASSQEIQGLPYCGHELYRLGTTRCLSELINYDGEVSSQDLLLISQQQALKYKAAYKDVYYEVTRLVRASDWHLREHSEETGVVVADNTVELCQRGASYIDYAQDNCSEFFQDVIITVIKEGDNRTTVSFQVATNQSKITREHEVARFTKMISENLSSLFVQG